MAWEIPASPRSWPLVVLAAVVTQYPVGRLSDRVDRRTVIAAVCVLATIVAVNILVFSQMPRVLFLILAGLFSGFALTRALLTGGLARERSAPEPAQMVAASSALIRLEHGAAAAVGPVLAGSLIAAYGPPAYFTTLATLTGALTIYDLWRKSRRKPVPSAQKGQFINAQPQAMSGQIVPGARLEPKATRQSGRDDTA